MLVYAQAGAGFTRGSVCFVESTFPGALRILHLFVDAQSSLCEPFFLLILLPSFLLLDLTKSQEGISYNLKIVKHYWNYAIISIPKSFSYYLIYCGIKDNDWEKIRIHHCKNFVIFPNILSYFFCITHIICMVRFRYSLIRCIF